MNHVVQKIYRILWNWLNKNKAYTILPDEEKLSSAVVRLVGCNPGPMTLGGTNTYIVGTGSRRILIDTGEPAVDAYSDHLANFVMREKIKFDCVICTHWHIDHVGGIPDLFRKGILDHNVKVLKHPNCREHFQQETDFASVEDNDVLVTEGATLRVLFTPGHTGDHICLLLEEENAVFSGDSILGEGTAVFEDLLTYMLSLKKLLDIKPLKIYPGHGPVVASPTSVISYYLEHRKQRERQILEVLLQSPSSVTAMDLVRVIYKSSTSIWLYPAAVINVTHHLIKLEKEQKVTRDQSHRRFHFRSYRFLLPELAFATFNFVTCGPRDRWRIVQHHE